MAGKIRQTGKGGVAALASLLCLGLGADSAMAQSSGFGCAGLETSGALPSVEGDGGMFYRIDPDLMMAHGLTEQSIMQLAQLSRALQAGGTTLIYLPMPTKALGQPWQLPRMAVDLGYDADIAATVYGQSLTLLGTSGVGAVDARRALAAASQQAPAYFGADPRLTGHGALALAKAVAGQIEGAEAAAAQPKSTFKTGEGLLAELPSDMRFDLQEHCQSPLPRLEIRRLVMTQGAAPGDLLDSDQPSAGIALLGTAQTGEPATNFAGLLQEQTGLSVAQYHVAQGGAFAAMSSYLTSPAFQSNRPAFLVWEHPIWISLGSHGDQPMRELIAAAGPACDIAVPMDYDPAARLLRADVSGLDQVRPHTLMLDTGGVRAKIARFSFVDAAGLRRTRTIYRRDDQHLTGRFYMPMSGLWPEGAFSVEIALDLAPDPSSRLFACLQEGDR